ncbi:MAG: hypothetical protein QOD72_3795 [Acidimicrobiaceae bacterium]|jgi:hypothetical protein|nr:hypothetical protein [Acidimicrobiaceae bacterium]
MSANTIQGSPIATEDLSSFRGSWVALRNGRVIASAIDALELRNNPDVRSDDWLILVPTDEGGALLL